MQIDMAINPDSVNEQQLKAGLFQQLKTILYLRDRLEDEGVRRVMEEVGVDEDKLVKLTAACRSLKVIENTPGAAIIGVNSSSEVYMLCDDEAIFILQNHTEVMKQMVLDILDNSGLLAQYNVPGNATKIKITWTTRGM